MLSAVFFEKAVWAFFALVSSLIAVIYKLFNGSLQKDLKIQKETIKDELETKFETKFNKKIETIEDEVGKLRDEIKSFKNHENNNSIYQTKLLKKVLYKLDNHDVDIFNEVINES
jgi:negative regulator of replication initiation